jgi:hypothetical protein
LAPLALEEWVLDALAGLEAKPGRRTPIDFEDR